MTGYSQREILGITAAFYKAPMGGRKEDLR